jgi:hypothetical protein
MFPWQVFGLCRIGPSCPDFPEFLAPVSSWAFVPAYRCGTVPDSHRIPYSLSVRRDRGIERLYLVAGGKARLDIVDMWGGCVFGA